MDINSSRQDQARRAMGCAEASIAAHGQKIEAFNVEIRRNRAIRHRALVLSASLGLLHASAALGAVVGGCCLACRRHASTAVGDDGRLIPSGPEYAYFLGRPLFRLHPRAANSSTASSSSSAFSRGSRDHQQNHDASGLAASGNSSALSSSSSSSSAAAAASANDFSSPEFFSSTGVLPLLVGGLLGGLGMAMLLTVNSASERHVYDLEYQRELWEIQNHVDGERQEMIEIYSGLGLAETDAALVTNVFSRYSPAMFAQLMMVEELGYARLPPLSTGEAVLHAALPTVVGYTLGLTIPLMPLFVALPWSRVGPLIGVNTEVTAARGTLALSAALIVAGSIAEGAARASVFLGSYAEHRTRILAALSTLTGAVTLFSGAYLVVRRLTCH